MIGILIGIPVTAQRGEQDAPPPPAAAMLLREDAARLLTETSGAFLLE
jgi:hypothetical protein